MQQIKMKNLLTMGGVFGIALAGLTLFSTLFSQDAAQANEPLNIEPRAANQITDTIQLDPAGSIDLDGAEIVAFDPDSDRFFVTSGDGLQIIDGSAPRSFRLSPFLLHREKGLAATKLPALLSLTVLWPRPCRPRPTPIPVLSSSTTSPAPYRAA